MDPRAVNVDWVSLRRKQEDRAKDDVKAELVVDRIATEEKIEITEEELQQELEHMAGHSGQSAEALRASLTKQGTLDRMKAKLAERQNSRLACSECNGKDGRRGERQVTLTPFCE